MRRRRGDHRDRGGGQRGEQLLRVRRRRVRPGIALVPALLASDSVAALIALAAFAAARRDPAHLRHSRGTRADLRQREPSEVACATGDLFLSEVTVKTHITRTFVKLDVTNRVQLTIFACEAGMVTP